VPPGEGDRRPGAVPDDGPAAADVGSGTDTDGDGRADTLLAVDGADLLVQTDLDGDGLADRVLRIGPDGAVHTVDPPDGGGPAWGRLLDALLSPDHGDAGI
jgi:hypothetical protein